MKKFIAASAAALLASVAIAPTPASADPATIAAFSFFGVSGGAAVAAAILAAIVGVATITEVTKDDDKPVSR